MSCQIVTYHGVMYKYQHNVRTARKIHAVRTAHTVRA